MPVIDAAPPAAARVEERGRSSLRKSRLHPNAFTGYAARKSTPATATSHGLACESGHPALAKCHPPRTVIASAATTQTVLKTRRKRGELHRRRNHTMRDWR